VPDEERLEMFREVWDQLEAKILYWLEHPEEIDKLRVERERERRERVTSGTDPPQAPRMAAADYIAQELLCLGL
jgi:hypothetical protein